MLWYEMPSFSSLPPWLPWWVPLVVAVPVLLYALVFVLMPFSVFGVKSRLEGVEVRLDEIQGEIRSLALRLPEPERGMPERGTLDRGMARRGELGRGEMESDVVPETPARPRVEQARPPIPPAPLQPEVDRRETRRRMSDEPIGRPSPSERAEPRLNWPR